MTTVEITISDNSKVALLLSLLKELSFVDVKNIKESVEHQMVDDIDPNYLDEETKRRISDSIQKNLSGDTSHVVEILRIDREESVFHEL